MTPREKAGIVACDKHLKSAATARLLSARCELWAQGVQPEEIERVLVDYETVLTKWRGKVLAVFVGDLLRLPVDPWVRCDVTGRGDRPDPTADGDLVIVRAELPPLPALK